MSRGDVDGGSAGEKKQKKTKLKQMYKRASRSTKTLTKFFSRSSPGSDGSSSSGGISKRSSLRSQLTTAPQHLSNTDPFASGSSVNSHCRSPFGTDPHSSNPHSSWKHLSKASSREVKPQLCINSRNPLKRSPSVSSPLGIPTSPSFTKVVQQWEQSNTVRGRHIPFPVNSSSVSLPLPRQRSRSATQSSVTSTMAQEIASKSWQLQDRRPPLPQMPSITSVRTQVRHSPAGPPQRTLPSPPLPRPLPTPNPTNSSSTAGPLLQQRLRSRSLRETLHRPVVMQGGPGTEAMPPQTRPVDVPRNPNNRTEEANIPNDAETGFLKNLLASTANHSLSLVQSRNNVLAIVPVPSMTAAFTEPSSSTNSESVTKPRPGAGSVPSNQIFIPDQSSPAILRNLSIPTPVALPPSTTMGVASSKDSSPARRPLPLPPAHSTRCLPRLVIENLDQTQTREDGPIVYIPPKNGLRSQPPMRIPRSPSLPSIRHNFLDAPSLASSKSSSYNNERRGRSHLRSPSLQTFGTKDSVPVGATTVQDRALTPQPLPSSITVLLRARSRSRSRYDGKIKRPSSAADTSSPATQPPAKTTEAKRRPALESMPSASTYGFSESPPHPSGYTLPIVSTSQPISRLPESRRTGRRRALSLKSPSMPDLYHATTDSCRLPALMPNRGPQQSHSLPPPQTQPQPHSTIPLQMSVSDTSQKGLDPIQHKPTSSDRSNLWESLPPPTPFLQSKPNLTRLKERPYTTSGRSFQARSNRELAKEGDWDFLDKPPRPARTSFVGIAPTPIVTNPKTTFPRSQSRPQKSLGRGRGEVIPPVPTIVRVANAERDRSRERQR